MTASILTILCPFAAVRCSLQSLSADRLMPASVTRSPSDSFKNLVVLSISSDSVSSASLKEICFRKSAVCYRVSYWSWEFNHCKKSSASARKKICVFHMTWTLWRNTAFNSEGKEKKNLATLYLSRSGKVSYIAGFVCWTFISNL